MTDKKIKIFLNNFEKTDVREFFPLKVLLKNFNAKIVSQDSDADLIIEAIFRGGKTYIGSHRKVLLIASDNMRFKKNLFSVAEAIIFRLGFRETKYKIMDRLDRVIPSGIASLPLLDFFPKYNNLIRQMEKNSAKDKYAILTNESESKNILSMPFFIQTYNKLLKKLTKKTQNDGNRKKFCAFAVSSNSSRERIKFFRQLSKYKKVDSYGDVMNNMGKDDKKNWGRNRDLFEQYKFAICFENSFDNEYVTEKIVNAMLAGAIPIYRGAPNIGEYFNTKSFINYDDYGSYEKMIEKIKELDNDPEKYRKMQKQPWFKDNRMPAGIANKEKELMGFYKKILGDKL